jgi:hypothetical protein
MPDRNQPTRTDRITFYRPAFSATERGLIQEEVDWRRRRRWFTFYRLASEAGKGKILRLGLGSGSVAASASRKGSVSVEELLSSPPAGRRPLRPSVPVTAAAIARGSAGRFVASCRAHGSFLKTGRNKTRAV